MAGLLNFVYSALALLVAVGGLAFVLGYTGRGEGTDRWAVLAVIVVGGFLVVMVADLVGLL